MEELQGDPSVCVILESFLCAVLLDEISEQSDHRHMEDNFGKRVQLLIINVHDHLRL